MLSGGIGGEVRSLGARLRDEDFRELIIAEIF